jgi:hypothetical protein
MTQTSKRAAWSAYDASPRGILRHARNNAKSNPTRSTINGIRTTRAAHIAAGRIIPTEYDNMAYHPRTGNRMSYETLDAVANFNATRKTIDGFRTTTQAHIAAGRLPATIPGPEPVEQKHPLELENDKLLLELDAYKAMLYKGADAAYDTYRDRQGWTNFIYVVVDNNNLGRCKVGVSYSPSKRVPDTDTWNPDFDPETVFKFALEGRTYQEAKDFERSLHNRLAQWGRVRFAKNGKLSEWFKIAPDTAKIVIRSHWNMRRT